MYHVLIISHIIILGIFFVISYLVYKRIYLTNWRSLVLTCGLCICYSLGYLLEACSTTLEAAKICLDLEYLGLSFLPAVFFFFIADFCDFKVSKTVSYILAGIGILIETLVILKDYSGLYYTSIDFEYSGLFPHVVLGHGIFYNFYIVVQFTLFIFAAVLIWRKRVREKNSKKRFLLTFIFIVSLLPLLAVGINLSRVFEEYDIGPLSCTIMLMVMLTLMMNNNLTDVVGVALMNLYSSLSNGIVILDNEGKFLNCNNAAADIFPELAVCKAGTESKELAEELRDYEQEHFFRKGNAYYSLSSEPIFHNKNHVGYLISINDVTQMHNQVEEMTALKEAADAASEAKSKFLTTMSHEIRTPLNAIIGMSTLSEMESDEQVLKENSHQIKAAGEALLDIVSEILDISKAESGKLEIVPLEYDLKELLEGVINICNMRIGSRPIKFFVDIDSAVPRRLVGDMVRIRQILLNYLSNAEKYTEKGSITLKVDYDKSDDGIILRCAVADTGRGIKENDIDVLFTPFTQVDTKKNHAIMGTGLGLSIVARLLDLMGGKYDVSSVYGEGSTFGFWVPQQVAQSVPLIEGDTRFKTEVVKLASFVLPAKDISDNHLKNAEEGKTFPNARVLIVDDNRVNLSVLDAFLKKFEITADKCNSGQRAIDSFSEHEYDLVFMDHMMPEMDGIEATRRIRALDNENAKTVPVIACTANVLSSAVEEFSKSGMNDFIAKPIIYDKLEEMLNKYLCE